MGSTMLFVKTDQSALNSISQKRIDLLEKGRQILNLEKADLHYKEVSKESLRGFLCAS